MKQKASTVKHSTFLQKKIQLLDQLIQNLQKEEEYLSYRDAESAVKLEFKNEAIVEKLEALDRQIYESKELDIYSSDEILITDELFQKLDLARDLQKRVQNSLEYELNESKKELWEFRIKRKLKSHFLQNSGLSWVKNYC
ncbi:MAG: flagellar protein FlgN [Leptospira sp.]|nr:flagellar protein FlgN [Leptospira sp.]